MGHYDCIYEEYGSSWLSPVTALWVMFEKAWRGRLSQWLLGHSLGCTHAHTKHASMSLAAGFVSLFAVLRDYRLRVFTGCFALDPHKSDVELTIPRCLGCRWGLSIIICFPSGASVFYEGRNNKTRNMASMTLSDSNCCHLSPKKRQHWKLGKQREWAFVSHIQVIFHFHFTFIYCV